MTTKTTTSFNEQLFSEWHYSGHEIADHEIKEIQPQTGIDREAIAYCLVHLGQNRTYILVVKLQEIDGDMITKGIPEESVPAYYECPERILVKASAPESDYAYLWRKKCRDIRNS